MAVLRIDIERALDELKSQEEGNRFQGLAVTLGKKRWPELIARQRKKDFGLRDVGAREVHGRIAATRTRFLCPFGFGIPPKGDVAVLHSGDQALMEHVGLDSLGCLSLASFHRVTGEATGSGGCDYCLSGRDPEESAPVLATR